MKIHECPDREIDGNDAKIEIRTNGRVVIDYENGEGMDDFITLKFIVCPFCAVKLDDTEPDSKEVTKKNDHRCINFHHGICMDCGKDGGMR